MSNWMLRFGGAGGAGHWAPLHLRPHHPPAPGVLPTVADAANFARQATCFSRALHL